ncbi:flagellar biosynthetic protein FliR [Klenkia sp. PcliD-1-E]|uniref:flagellar biosynthetic protein FliR n=1 Tax=Klenkia sp. PcliD-1-E TaxID=2954492 RepID=UPI002097F334|nr:flagellar biosynthetic protein FliR [Klenkia sp. PcliD-1-E]MCO7221729.1 flagellar biosynthetic protein FliR [Klenkia sp. PcliD-1-E]
MDLDVSEATLAAMLLATARTAGFVLLAPPFNSKAIPGTVKGALSVCLALVVFHQVEAQLGQLSTGYLVLTALTEVVIGAALGFVVQLFFAAVQLAGDILDVTGGFSLQPAYDPLSMSTASTIGRLQNLLAIGLLFTSGGHLLLVRGLWTSYQGLPLGAVLPTEQIGPTVVHAMSTMFLAALQIAGPLVAVLLLSDVALGLLSRASPQMNIFSLGFPVKIMLTLLMLGLTFPLLPTALDTLLETATRAFLALKAG